MYNNDIISICNPEWESKVMKRSIIIKFKDGTTKELELVKATGVRTSQEMLHLDKINNGWRLIWNENLIPDFSQIVSFDMYREEENE